MNRAEIEQDLERLIHDYGNDVLRIAYMYLKDRDLAQDAFQEVFIKIYKKWDTFRSESSEKTWITKITINVCKDLLKQSWMKNVDLMDFEAFDSPSDSLEFSPELQFDKQDLFQKILTLPNHYKEVVILYYYQGFDVKEIAMVLETTIGNVTSLLKRAREALRKKL